MKFLERWTRQNVLLTYSNWPRTKLEARGRKPLSQTSLDFYWPVIYKKAETIKKANVWQQVQLLKKSLL